MDKLEQVNFGLRKISTMQFAIIDSSFNEKINDIEYETRLRYEFNIEKRIINVIVMVNFSQDKGPFIILEIGCYFEIEKGDWKKIYDVAQNEIKIPLGAARHLVLLSIGTLRGVLHSKVENTPFNMFILPTINVNELVNEEVLLKTNDLIEKK